MITDPPNIRQWARDNGFTVAARGRIAPAIHAAYREAFGVRERPANGAHCTGCGRTWTGQRECHCTVCHRQFSTVRWFDDHRRNSGRNWCVDPLSLSNRDGSPKFKIAENAWGPIVVSATERPDDINADDDQEPALL